MHDINRIHSWKTQCKLNDLGFFLDCYARAAFGKHSKCTETLHQTICPSWDQTLIFDHVEIHDSLENITQHPPHVFLEFFDHDNFVSRTIVCLNFSCICVNCRGVYLS